MSRVFLSHVRADRAQARRLAEALRQAGYTPWLAEDEARVGESVPETLSRGLKDTQAAVVLLSRTSVESAWTSNEVALLRTHDREQPRLYVARLDRVAPPTEVAEERAIDLFPGETAWQSGVKRLLHMMEEAGPDLPGDKQFALPPNNLPPRAAPFVGRKQELVALHERLMTTPVSGSVLLTGRRGAGKTALAVEYATRYAADYPGGIWRVPAQLGPRTALAWLLKDLDFSDIPSVEKQVLRIKADASSEDVAQGVLRALQSNPEPSLLILDEVADAGWQHFLPLGNVRVLATSRSPSLVRLERARLHPLSALSPEDVASLLFMARSPRVDTRFVQRLREKPFLAVLVARLLEHRQASWSSFEEAVRHRVLGTSRADTRVQGVAFEHAVIDLCIEQFPPDSLTYQLLVATAFFAPAIELDARLAWGAVSEEGLYEEDLPEEVRQALETLGRSGLLQVWGGEDAPLCRMSRSVRQRLRGLAAPTAWKQSCEKSLSSALHGARDADTFGGDWALERLRPHLEAVLRATAHLTASRDWSETADLLATHLSKRGEYLTAQWLWQQALRRTEQDPDSGVELLGGLRAKLASAHTALGDTTTALRLLERAVADDASHPVGDETRRARRLADLALLQHDIGQPEAALESIDRALKLDREALAESDREFPLRLFLRGRILRLLRRHEEAHTTLEEALEVGEYLTEEDPFFLVPLMEALAVSRRERHDEQGALALLQRVIEEDPYELGDAHHETLFHLTELARTYAEFERRRQTRSTVDRVLARLDKELPPTDTRRIELLLRLAESLQKVDEHEDAHRLLARALDVEAAQPEPDFSRLSALVMTALLRSGQSHDLPLLERALSLAQRGAGKLPTAAEPLVKLLVHVLDTTEPAAPPTRSPIQTSSPGAGAESLERALRLARRSQVRDEVKAEALQEALTAAQQGDDLPNGARACLLLADLEGRRGAWEQARVHARQGLQLALRAELPPLVAEGYRVLGDTALHGSFYEEARMSYEEAIRRYDSLGDSGSAARTRMLLVTLLMQLGHLEGLEDHVRWLDEHQQHPSLTEEDREDVRKVLALAGARLSSPTPGARHPRS